MKKRMLYTLLIVAAILLVACHGGEETENGMNTNFKMTATVQSVGEKIQVDVVQAEYTSGIHWVITSEATEFFGKNGDPIDRADLAPGDTVEILYNGQVMMSYPPQIVAVRITVK